MRLYIIRLIAMLALIILVAPLAAMAQQPGRVYRIGCIPGGPLAPRAHQWEAFRQTLRELGWVEGQNIILEFRPPSREGDPFDELAAELVRLKVDVIVASGGQAAYAAKQATSTIPIVMSPAGDPVGLGLVTSLSRPGGNVTGLSIMVPDLHGKRLEILKEIVPGVSRVAVLWTRVIEQQLPAVRTAARRLGVELLEVQVTEEAAEVRDLDHAFETASRDRADAMIVPAHTLFYGLRARITDLALHHRLPAIYMNRAFTHAGGLVSYGQNDTEYYRRAAVYVDKLLKGAKPEDLPVEQLMKFEFVINVKTAKALGLTIPPTLLFQADEVIR
jgi:putative ABC transport system substrate-binding protein